MKSIKITTILFALISVLIACDKDDDHNSDTQAPMITINSPMNSVEGLTDGDSIHIHVSVTDNDAVHDANAVLTHTHMGVTTEVWSNGGHSHSGTTEIHGDYVIDVSGMHNDFVLEVTANDHSGNEATQTSSFHVHM